jgi:hydroxymethylbilane synthase
MKDHLRLGTRRSRLAQTQTIAVRDALQAVCPELTFSIVPILTRGDKNQSEDIPLPPTGLKGMFTEELEDQLLSGEIDIAVHSIKDLPASMDERFELGAILLRIHPLDVLVSRNNSSLAELPSGAVVGTSSVRRGAQILAVRPDLKIQSVRGNVETRLGKLDSDEYPYDALVLAEAGLVRLGLEGRRTQVFSAEEMLPAPGQGALGVQCRAGDERILNYLASIDDSAARAAVVAERCFVDVLEASCNTPVAAYAEVTFENTLQLTGKAFRHDGTAVASVFAKAPLAECERLGRELGEEALQQGFDKLLADYHLYASGVA